MNPSPLSACTRAPASGGAPDSIILFLHGLGADGNDLIGLADELDELLPNTLFLSPNAPEPCDMAPFGYQWFSLQERSETAMLSGVKMAAPVLNAFIDAQLATYHLPSSRMAVVGFSQGTMMALYTLPRRPAPCAGIIGFSGALIGADLLPQEAASKPPVCLIHGDMDMVVPFAAMAHAQTTLEGAGIACSAHRRAMLGHGIDGEALRIAADHLHTWLG